MVRVLALAALVGMACSGGTALQLDASADVALADDAVSADAVVSTEAVAPDAAATVDLASDLAPEVAQNVPTDAVTDAEIMDAPVTLDGAPDGSEPADTMTIACTGSFSGITLKQLQAAIAVTGACAAPGDVFQICTASLAQIAGVCGLRCLGKDQPCIVACIKDDSSLSDGCAGCYAATVLCTQVNCLADCLNDPSSPRCAQCQMDKKCRPTFRTCTGLP